jgi:hypothetical protein
MTRPQWLMNQKGIQAVVVKKKPQARDKAVLV